MTLETYEYEGQGVVQVRMTECPLCEYAFAESEPRWRHFYHQHSPADAGLSPLGTVADDFDGPLWESPNLGSDAEREPV